MIERISKKIGFTRTEILVLLFLVGLFIIGFVYVEFIKPANKPDYKFIDYSRQDSLFESANNLNAEESETISNQKVKNEVLELGDTINYSVKSTETLTEKSININTADVKELTQLPGIGEKTAQKIVDLRKARGKFKHLEELMDVSGIGEVKFNKIEKFLYIK